jgi:hypothetical protein
MDKGSWIKRVIKDFVEKSPLNDMGFAAREKIFATPLVGFSSGADPLYKEYKAHIGSFYFTPLELFAKTFPDKNLAADDITVISWIIPSTAATRKEQAEQDRYPSERWVRTRDIGEKFNNAIRTHVVEQLEAASIGAVAPLRIGPDRRKGPMRPVRTGPSAMEHMLPALEPLDCAMAS